MIMTPNDVFPNVVCHGNGNNTGQLRTLRGMGGLGCVGRKTYFQKSGSLMLVPFLLTEIIKKPKNNWTFSLQFVYQAWITDPKTALRQRRKEKKRSAREEQKRRKGSGEGKCCVGTAGSLPRPCLGPRIEKRNNKGQTLRRNNILKLQRAQRVWPVYNYLCLTLGINTHEFKWGYIL